MPIRVLIVDDHQMMRQGLQALVDRESDMEVTGTADNGRTAVKMVSEHQPDVVVMDVEMHDLNGIQATRQIRSEHPDVLVLALSVHAERQFVTGMLAAGAMGYILKLNAFEELVDAIHTIVKQKVYLAPSISRVVVEDYVQYVSDQKKPKESPLTPREKEILQLLTEGNSSKEVGAHLNISVKTVDTHRRHIMEKLDLYSLPELTKYAIRNGITTL